MADTPTTQTLIDVIVFVFAKSDLRDVVGTDALRTVLEGSARDLFPEPGKLTLQPVYDLLADQPGFDDSKVIAPMCRLKTWEGLLKTKIELPTALAGLDRRAMEDKAITIAAFESDLEKLLKPPSKDTPAPIARVLESETVPDVVRQQNSRVKRAAAFALIGLVAAGISIYLTVFRGGDKKLVTLAPSDISTVIPLKNVRKSPSGIIVAVLADNSWIDKPLEERRVQMKMTIDKLRLQHSTSFMLVDSSGTPIGTVNIRNKPTVSFTSLPHPH